MYLEPGKYKAKAVNKRVAPTKAETGLLFWITCEVIEGEHAGKQIKALQTLVSNDGALQSRNIETLKEVFGWDGQDPFWLEDNDISGATFEIVIENETGDGGKLFSKVKYINSLGGGSSSQLPAPISNRSSILAKYGGQFRAMAGPASVAARPTAPAPASPKVAPAPAKAPAAPKAKLPTCTMQDAWEEWGKAHEGMSEDEMTNGWFAHVEKLFPGRNNNLTPEEWHKVKSEIDQVPV